MSPNSVLNQPIGIHECSSFWANKESSFWTLIYILFIYWSVYVQLKIRYVSLCICDLILVIACSQVCFLTFLALFSTPERAKYAPASNHINHSVVSDSLRPSWNVAHHAHLSMGCSMQGNCSALPFPPPGDLPDPGIEPVSPALQANYSLSYQRSPQPQKRGPKKKVVTKVQKEDGRK